MMQQFKLIGVSAVLSMMLWAVADQSLTSTATLRVRLDVAGPEGSTMRVSMVNASRRPFEFQISGKKPIIHSLKALEPLKIQLRITERETGRYTLDLREELRNQPTELSEVFVRNIEPDTLEIEVDHDITVPMPLEVRSSGTVDYEIRPQADVSEVKVIISERAYRELPNDQRRVLLDPDDSVRTAKQGELRTDSIPLEPLVAGIPVQLDPDYVKLTFKLLRRLKESQVKAVPIKFEASREIFNSYKIGLREDVPVLTQSITIKGPPDVIDRIVGGGVSIHGVIELKAEDKDDPGNFRYFEPQFSLPEGVTLVSDPERIEIRLMPIPAAERLTP